MQACTSWKESKQNPAVYIVEQRRKQPPANQHTATDTSLFSDEAQSERLGRPCPEVSPPQDVSQLALCHTQWIYTKKPYFLLSPCSNSESKGQTGCRGATERGSICFLLFTHKYLHLPFLGQQHYIYESSRSRQTNAAAWHSCPISTVTQLNLHSQTLGCA